MRKRLEMIEDIAAARAQLAAGVEPHSGPA
jgi:hypothetical protein